MKITEFTNQLNEWGKERTPFLFIVDFELEKPLTFLLSEVDDTKLKFDFNGFANTKPSVKELANVELSASPIPYFQYQQKFNKVAKQLAYGNSFLTNLTIRTPISINKTLADVYELCEAKYKLLFRDSFLFFSPEPFVRIENGKIYSYPMKGTIDSAITNAEQIILADEKEKAEHTTIVDLIRNDLSLVAENVTVTKFRYVEKIKTNNKILLQVSSEIFGDLPANYLSNLGNILVSLFPAGSVSGAPKEKTLEIIREAEQEKRGYYAGIAGYFDGEKLDSAVVIRFIENSSEQLYYRSGGGITTQSDCKKEYEEALAKIYVPIV
jgi:para-aminobenzoate synthetase component I